MTPDPSGPSLRGFRRVPVLHLRDRWLDVHLSEQGVQLASLLEFLFDYMPQHIDQRKPHLHSLSGPIEMTDCVGDQIAFGKLTEVGRCDVLDQGPSRSG